METYIRSLEAMCQSQDSYGSLQVPVVIDKMPVEIRKQLEREKDCACTWPAAFANSVWEGTRGQLTFGSSTLGGLAIDVSSLDPSAGSLSTWECVNTDYFQAEGILLLKSTKKFNHINALFLAYFCFTMTRVTGVEAFYFYQSHAMEPSLNNERIKIHQSETFTTKAQICGATPPMQEFYYMVKQGQELMSKQFCPPSLLARMEYNVTSSNGAVSCTGPADSWDGCTDRTKMTFNYSTCATQMMYSSEGRAYCLFNLTATHHYTMVYSNGTSGSKFICVVSNSAGTAASFVEGRCGQSNQSPTTFATSDGSDVGFTVTMSAAGNRDIYLANE
ncbi:uncharacterized protein LOC127849319 [Dreissena polymorpha]|uniref:uncharacterized protein LOC127849319 n=1 Tax=Dreissena polymorpha TaxID=45954 RepID=UPI002263FCDF|nr:uncharacterized protein LOC127849319 [Dreissena polymorpha]